MKEKLVFATNNAHKLEEVSAMLGERIELLSLRDIGCHADIPETGTTLEENALLKARYVNEHFNRAAVEPTTSASFSTAPLHSGWASTSASGCAAFSSTIFSTENCSCTWQAPSQSNI